MQAQAVPLVLFLVRRKTIARGPGHARVMQNGRCQYKQPDIWTSPYFCSDRRAGTQTWNRPLFVTSYAYLLLASRPAPGVYGG